MGIIVCELEVDVVGKEFDGNVDGPTVGALIG